MKRNIYLTFASLLLVIACLADSTEDAESEIAELRAQLDSAVESINELRSALSKLSRQTMQQQFAVEERSRLSGNSGLKLIRSRRRGQKNYESPSHVGFAVNAIHDHPNYIRTLGMGEVAVLMNGVEFRTRHNDYKLVMPSTNSTDYRVTEPIPFPEVPPSVTGTIQEQADEMIEWFKAFQTQNTTHRDYTKYFKPVFCYMEGAWTLDKTLLEPFRSERHHVDANSWFNLYEKVRFSAMTGTKNAQENLAYLPTTLLSTNETSGESEYAQWNYRILCKPLDRDIPFSSLVYVDDLAYRMRDGRSIEQTLQTRAARFKLYDDTKSDTYQLLDEVFYTVPGMDNIPSDDLRQETFGEGDLFDVAENKKTVVLKNGYYHRVYKYAKKGAMGLALNPRGFNDENRWVAQTTQPNIAPVCLEICQREIQPNGRRPKVCRPVCNRFTYAIPLEIVYMTPLLSWNPYDIPIHQDHKTAVSTGGDGYQKPFFGADLNRYYLTPTEMFDKSDGSGGDAADTAKRAVRILDSNDDERRTVATGTRIWTDEIPGVGRVRLRYPIAPVADEGSSVWKELTAFKDLFFDTIKTNKNEEKPLPPEVFFQMSYTVRDPPGEHTHDIGIPTHLIQTQLFKGRNLLVATEQGQGHTHNLRIRYDKDNDRFYYSKCDGRQECWDGHPTTIVSKSEETDEILERLKI